MMVPYEAKLSKLSKISKLYLVPVLVFMAMHLKMLMSSQSTILQSFMQYICDFIDKFGEKKMIE